MADNTGGDVDCLRHSFPDFEHSASGRRDMGGRRGELFRRIDFPGGDATRGCRGDDPGEAGAMPADAARQAYEAGYQEGLEAGRESAEARLQPLAESLGEALREVRRIGTQICSAAEAQAVELALAVARRVIGREAATDRRVVMHSLRQALADLSKRSEVTLVLHPEDAAFLKGLAPAELFGDGEAAARVDFEVDPDMARGGCLVKTPVGDRDASIEGQMGRIAAAFEEALQQSGTENGPVEKGHAD